MIAVFAALESPDLYVDSLILGAALVLAVGVLGTVLADQFRVPSLLFFLALGMILADDGLQWLPFDNASLAQNLSVLALIVILFDGGLSTRTGRLVAVLRPAGALATVGVVLSAALVAGALIVVFDTDATTAWLIGAVVSSTDAAAVFTALRNTSLPTRLHDTVEAESGLNDPIAVLLTIGLLQSSEQSVGIGDWLVFGVRQILLGAIVGCLVGVVGAALIGRVRLTSIAAYPVLAFATAGAAYGFAVLVHGSGFLAVYLAGVVLSERAGRYRRALRSFQAGLASVAQVGLFFMLGLLVFPSELADVAGQALFVAVVLALVARPVAVLVSDDLVPMADPADGLLVVGRPAGRGPHRPGHVPAHGPVRGRSSHLQHRVLRGAGVRHRPRHHAGLAGAGAGPEGRRHLERGVPRAQPRRHHLRRHPRPGVDRARRRPRPAAPHHPAARRRPHRAR